MKTGDIVEYLQKIVPMDLAEPWDNVGLQCGDKNKEIKKIVIALDPSTKGHKLCYPKRSPIAYYSPSTDFFPSKEIGSL
ncbi:MAG: NIF3 (NGG1p interacting factor 3) [Candidatus Methanoperedenaceae archaeon GB37]|nr:MAG: NIF3 (NGG1p interacting factor 3) [Candidatus Methanoperedenaceae archaeon GB37]